MTRAFFALLLFASCGPTHPSNPYDHLILGATVFDGSGAPGFRADVAIVGDRIAAIGDLRGRLARRSVDGSGKILCPGFIDLHTHSDEPILEDGLRQNLSYLTQGCTTVVTGNCGSGHVDVADFFARLERQGAGTNVAHLVPHGSLRDKAMGGSHNRVPSAQELDKMRSLMEQGMQAGAFGMTTGLIYTPGTYAGTEEIVELAKVVARYGGFYASHIRSEGDQLLSAIEEAISIGEQAGCPVHVSHFKAAGPANWGRVREASAKIEAAKIRVTCDQYPYRASSTSLAAMTIPAWAREGEDADLVRRLDDPEAGPKIREAIAESFVQRGGADKVLLARYRANEKWNGKRLDELVRETGTELVDLVIAILKKGGASAVSFGMCDEDVEFVMKKEYVATASDGGSKRPDESRPHPRSYGTFSRKIGHYSIERKLLSLPQAIRSATGLPAKILGLRDRGTVRVGYAADLVLFDPDTFRDHATYEDPHRYSTGVEWLWVNGQAAISEGKDTGVLAGRVLRHSP